LTDVVAMDCEMVGVGQGNKSALARVTLVIICSSSSCYGQYFVCMQRVFFVYNWDWLISTAMWLPLFHIADFWCSAILITLYENIILITCFLYFITLYKQIVEVLDSDEHYLPLSMINIVF
jgi:hypothetical protein